MCIYINERMLRRTVLLCATAHTLSLSLSLSLSRFLSFSLTFSRFLLLMVVGLVVIDGAGAGAL